MGIIMAPDNVENCKRAATRLFDFLIVLHECHERKEYYELNGKYYDFEVGFPADMKAHQTIQERGGGSYMTKWFCLCCDKTNHTKGLASAFRCQNCTR
jgi:hypothetical protein